MKEAKKLQNRKKNYNESTENRNNKLLELKLKNGSLEKELDFNDFKNKDLLKDRGLLKY